VTKGAVHLDPYKRIAEISCLEISNTEQSFSGRGSAPDPFGELTALSQTPLLVGGRLAAPSPRTPPSVEPFGPQSSSLYSLRQQNFIDPLALCRKLAHWQLYAYCQTVVKSENAVWIMKPSFHLQKTEHVSVVADGPARRATSRASCCIWLHIELEGQCRRLQLYIGWNDVTESTATIRSPFCAYNMA